MADKATVPHTNIHSVLQEQRKFECPEEFRRGAHIKSAEDYDRIYREVIGVEPKPARTTVQIGGFESPILVEVDATLSRRGTETGDIRTVSAARRRAR